MITLRQLQFALAVKRHKHFKHAAEECQVSQSALSLGIAELEKILGVVIFERNNKQVVITSIGEELLKRGQKIYLDAQQLIEQAQAAQNQLGFAMSIGFIPSIAPFLLPLALPEIQKKYPNFEMNISEDLSHRLVQAVQSGLIDAAILALPFDINGLQAIEFASEQFFIICHKNHPLAAEKKINPSKLAKYPPLLLGDGHCLKDHIVDICQLSISENNRFREASLNTLIQLTVNNMGYTLIPQMALTQMKNYSGLKIIPLDVAGKHRKLAAVIRPNYPRIAELNLLVDIFVRVLEKN